MARYKKNKKIIDKENSKWHVIEKDSKFEYNPKASLDNINVACITGNALPTSIASEEIAINNSRARKRASDYSDIEAVAAFIREMSSKNLKDRDFQILSIQNLFPEFNKSDVIGYTAWNGITRFIYKGIKKNVIL